MNRNDYRSILSRAIKVANGNFFRRDNVLVSISAPKLPPDDGHIFIGIPGVARLWLKADGTYTMDIPNEAA